MLINSTSLADSSFLVLAWDVPDELMVTFSLLRYPGRDLLGASAAAHGAIHHAGPSSFFRIIRATAGSDNALM